LRLLFCGEYTPSGSSFYSIDIDKNGKRILFEPAQTLKVSKTFKA
jgi:hypothetical protein